MFERGERGGGEGEGGGGRGQTVSTVQQNSIKYKRRHWLIAKDPRISKQRLGVNYSADL